MQQSKKLWSNDWAQKKPAVKADAAADASRLDSRQSSLPHKKVEIESCLQRW